MVRSFRIAALAVLGAALAGCAGVPSQGQAQAPAPGGVVKVTPLGGFDGEFCAQDRALVFEDPNGTRVLYDPGRSVMRATDPRLGKIDILLVSHMHGDHLGNAYTKVRGLYGARLAVMNIGDGFTTGPSEAAYVINDLVKPATVIASHANEAGTVGGKVRPGSKTEAFVKAVNGATVVVPLSGKTMSFDGAGKCTAGC